MPNEKKATLIKMDIGALVLEKQDNLSIAKSWLDLIHIEVLKDLRDSLYKKNITLDYLKSEFSSRMVDFVKKSLSSSKDYQDEFKKINKINTLELGDEDRMSHASKVSAESYYIETVIAKIWNKLHEAESMGEFYDSFYELLNEYKEQNAEQSLNDIHRNIYEFQLDNEHTSQPLSAKGEEDAREELSESIKSLNGAQKDFIAGFVHQSNYIGNAQYFLLLNYVIEERVFLSNPHKLTSIKKEGERVFVEFMNNWFDSQGEFIGFSTLKVDLSHLTGDKFIPGVYEKPSIEFEIYLHDYQVANIFTEKLSRKEGVKIGNINAVEAPDLKVDERPGSEKIISEFSKYRKDIGESKEASFVEVENSNSNIIMHSTQSEAHALEKQSSSNQARSYIAVAAFTAGVAAVGIGIFLASSFLAAPGLIVSASISLASSVIIAAAAYLLFDPKVEADIQHELGSEPLSEDKGIKI